MLSIACFPLALLLFQLTESAILIRDAVRIRLSTRRHLPNSGDAPSHVHGGCEDTDGLRGEIHAKKWAAVASSVFFAVGPDVSPE